MNKSEKFLRREFKSRRRVRLTAVALEGRLLAAALSHFKALEVVKLNAARGHSVPSLKGPSF